MERNRPYAHYLHELRGQRCRLVLPEPWRYTCVSCVCRSVNTELVLSLQVIGLPSITTALIDIYLLSRVTTSLHLPRGKCIAQFLLLLLSLLPKKKLLMNVMIFRSNFFVGEICFIEKRRAAEVRLECFVSVSLFLHDISFFSYL